MTPHLRHLTSLENLSRATIERLLDRAEALRDAGAEHDARRKLVAHRMLPRDPGLLTRASAVVLVDDELSTGRTVLNLFFEPSTRTRTSFELAARRLGADVVNFNIGLSSTQ